MACNSTNLVFDNPTKSAEAPTGNADRQAKIKVKARKVAND